MTLVYDRDDSLPAVVMTIALNGAEDINFASGWTFTLTLSRTGEDDVEKTTGMTGGIGQVTVEWDPDGELDIAGGTWRLYLVCTRSADGRKFTARERVYIRTRPEPSGS